MNPEQTRLARRRLALGITNVGFWVLAAAGGLLWLLIHGTGAVSLSRDGVILLGATAIQAGFDWLGGAVLMPAPRPTGQRFLRSWLPGALEHLLILAGVGTLSYASFRVSGGFTPAIVLATVGLAWLRPWVLRAVAGVRVARTADDGGTVLAAQTDDPAFTGGIVGWGSGAPSLLPASWLQNLPGPELAAERRRRRWQVADGLPGRTLLLVLGWNVSGAALGAWVFRFAAHPPAGALLLHACWMTLWTFGSLLILPSLSRQAVFAADRAARDAGENPRAWITHFPALGGEDGGANGLVQAIFYPVPSAARRLRRLDGPRPAGFVPGNLARSNLYYSWAACTLLGRAVHCNVGRPALWVFPPSA